MKSLQSYFYRVGAWAGYEMPPEILLDIAVHFRDVAKLRGQERPDDKLKAKNLITLALEAGGDKHPHFDHLLRDAEANGDADIVTQLKDWMEKHEPKKPSASPLQPV